MVWFVVALMVFLAIVLLYDLYSKKNSKDSEWEKTHNEHERQLNKSHPYSGSG